jgi:NADPH:quinone reductase-like Zn-dependent oxidoreductase
MRAVVVRSLGETPTVTDFPDPVAGPGEEVVEILAAGVHQLVRSMAAGVHYASPKQFPFVPGVDAVARSADGRRGYVGYARAPYGTVSELTVIPAGWSLPIPAESTVSDAVFAGSMNPMASVWMALVHRAALQSGERVLVLGATGASGRLAVALAGEFGAGSVVAAGRNRVVLQDLSDRHGAVTVPLTEDAEQMSAALSEVIADVDVVIDYVWGPVAEAAITAISRVNHGRRIRYVEVGSMAGAQIGLPSAALRSTGLEILGSGMGSVDPSVIAAAMPDLLARVASGALAADVVEVPLADAAAMWSADLGGKRLVIVP